jgi:hypothetical protein
MIQRRLSGAASGVYIYSEGRRSGETASWGKLIAYWRAHGGVSQRKQPLG